MVYRTNCNCPFDHTHPNRITSHMLITSMLSRKSHETRKSFSVGEQHTCCPTVLASWPPVLTITGKVKKKKKKKKEEEEKSKASKVRKGDSLHKSKENHTHIVYVWGLLSHRHVFLVKSMNHISVVVVCEIPCHLLCTNDQVIYLL